MAHWELAERSRRDQRRNRPCLNLPLLATHQAMLADSDVFITNVRGAALKRSGLDYATIHAEIPSLIYAQLSAWGQTGPMAVRGT